LPPPASRDGVRRPGCDPVEEPAIGGHDISLKGNGVGLRGKIVSNGGESLITIADLKPGTYTYYCSVPGHEAAGMKGTLTVS
jgi:plastocyanin